MKRFLLLVTTALIVVAVAVPPASTAAVQKAVGQKKGGNKPPKEPEPESRFRLALADRVDPMGVPTDTLRSDGRIRQDPVLSDADLDGFGDLSGPFAGMGGPIFYQDQLITSAQSGIHPDPCNVSNTSDAGLARMRLNAFNCSVENPVFQDDDRTFTLMFDRDDGDKDDDAEGGSCACDKFSYLTGSMLGGASANSKFVEN